MPQEIGLEEIHGNGAPDADGLETQEWLDSLESVLQNEGPERASLFAHRTEGQSGAQRRGDSLHRQHALHQHHPADRKQPPFPGSREIERRIKSLVRWNAMAMVVRANKRDGRHRRAHLHLSPRRPPCTKSASTTSSAARDTPAAAIWFTSRATPRRASTPGLSSKADSPSTQLENFRRELAPGGGLSSYPHPWLMPNFWQFPTVSMGLGPIMAIYQARFNRYLRAPRPEGHLRSRMSGASSATARPMSRNRSAPSRWPRAKDWTISSSSSTATCSASTVRSAATARSFRSWKPLSAAPAGTVIKVIWGSDWDPLLARDQHRPAGPAHGRGRRWRISEIRRRAGRLHPRALLRQVSRIAPAGRAHVRRAAAEAEPRRP